MRLYKLTKTDEFSSVFSFKKRYYGEWLFAHIKPNGHPHHRFGLVVSKKVSKLAVRRNYMKRVLKALILEHRQPVQSGYDIVLQVRKPFNHASFAAVAQDLKRLLQRLTQRSSMTTMINDASLVTDNTPSQQAVR